MKYRPKYPGNGFSNLEDARKWVSQFVSWYNCIHLHSGINFITPYQRHYGLDIDIIKNRIKIYNEARAKHPERWSKDIRNWSLPKYVTLNPMKEEEIESYISWQNK